ncbi:MAG TPA: imidazolonepropionase [Kofleriaceae bacterium]|nr:imidazolonepropionase [Kofleriaceae bacterium]
MLIRNARVMTCDPSRPGLGIVEHASIAIDNSRIVAIGDVTATGDVIDAKGALVTPGLIDCHTHAAFAGDRANEFAMRAAGESYEAVAAAGGGINATLGPTRAAIADGSIDSILHDRLVALRAAGTTTCEVKTGYALTTEGELALLDAIVRSRAPLRRIPTLLAHLVPPERTADRAAFVAEICEQWIPRAHAATSVDVWCEQSAFTLDETVAICDSATRAGKRVRGHVGQLHDIGGADVLARFRALSVDHLELVSSAGIAALARAGTVAVMLPGACVQLRLPVPPIAELRAAGVPLAIATDLNPGSSYCESLAVQMWLATTHFQMTIEEAWLGVTRHAARALGLEATHVGMLAPGAPAELVIWTTDSPIDVCYRYGTSLVGRVLTP